MTDRSSSASLRGLTVGVDLGGTNMQVGVVDDRLEIVGRAKRKTRAKRGLDVVLDRVVEAVHDACDAARVGPDEIAAVGVGLPGAIDLVAGVVLAAPNLGWRGVPVRDLLSRRLGRPVTIENDVNAAVWGEANRGAGRGHRDQLGVWIGTGVGGGLVIGGEIFRGSRQTAGEIGQIVVDPAGAPLARTLENIASRTGMVHQLELLLPRRRESVLHAILADGDGEIGSRELAEAHARRDPLVVEVVEHAAATIGAAIANLVTVLSLDAVVIGGGVTEAIGEPLLDRIRAHFERWVFPDELRSVPLHMTALGPDAGVIGAALLADGVDRR